MAFGYNPYPQNYQTPPTYLPGGGYPPNYSAYPPRQDAPQPFVQQTAQSNGISARLVTGREEAVAAQVIPDGNIWVFADFAHGTIYTKQVNPQTLAADFREYRLQSPQAGMPAAAATEQPTPPQYVTLDEFTALKNEVQQFIAAQNVPAATTVREAKSK